MSIVRPDRIKPEQEVKPPIFEHVIQSGITRESLIVLHETEGIGNATIRKIVDQGYQLLYPSLSDASKLREGEWRELGAKPEQASAIVASFRPDVLASRVQWHLKHEVQLVTYLDEGYPPLLREIADPPWVLYYKGNWKLTAQLCIGVVGTRLATAYGRKVAEELSARCANRLTIVSGLARGIDTAAHIGALRGEYGTIAVMASPINQCYPPENRQLYEQIAQKGLIVTEVAPGTKLHKGMFPMRNRIIAALSRGVIVVEAALKSGALITADLAMGYNRDVFIVPGPVTSPSSQGALDYFRQGAYPVLDESDIFFVYQHDIDINGSAAKEHSTKRLIGSEGEKLTPNEQLIYDILHNEPLSIDEIVDKSGMSFGHLHSVLLSLTIKRRIHQQPGSVYNVL
ncbi:MAG: DNA-processing protein DprA [Candidatus Cohnella colombiensis]|uniref:DNA-processing protein DprA n=1 Tax=Candidatus Cohnella colombiensis TaxID=3121368 RepID=A0AA95F0E1_9BACL|nr:MAG: DNA-processing protein DprA [Cohnella sp.]